MYKLKKFFGNLLIYVIIILLCMATLYPFLHSLLLSFHPQGMQKLSFDISKMDLNTWKTVFGSGYLFVGLKNSVIRTVLGSLISMLLMLGMAYPLSRDDFFGGKLFNKLLVLSMLVSAGTIPNYLLIKNLGMLDTIWSLILPGAINVYNLVVLKSSIKAFPKSVEEAALIDGANDIIVFFRFVIPLSMPVIATIGLWVILEHWNSWFDVIMYISSREKNLLPGILQEIISNNSMEDIMNQKGANALPPKTDSIKAATTMFATIPILMVYPFLQKYFAKGVTVGSVKE